MYCGTVGLYFSATSFFVLFRFFFVFFLLLLFLFVFLFCFYSVAIQQLNIQCEKQVVNVCVCVVTFGLTTECDVLAIQFQSCKGSCRTPSREGCTTGCR